MQELTKGNQGKYQINQLSGSYKSNMSCDLRMISGCRPLLVIEFVEKLNSKENKSAHKVFEKMSTLEKLKQNGTIQDYYEVFNTVLSKTGDLKENQIIRYFINGLQPEIKSNVSMFKPHSLMDAYSMAKVQEDTIEVMKRYSSIFSLTRPNEEAHCLNAMYQSSITTNIGSASQAITKVGAITTPHKKVQINNNVCPNKKQLTQKDLEEKLTKNLCLYCDQGYVPGHRCSGQRYVIEILGKNESGVQSGDKKVKEEEKELVIENKKDKNALVPYLSLNALHGTNAFQTMRVIGRVQQQVVHIMTDSNSTHNFLNLNSAKRFGCQFNSVDPMQVIVPGSNNITTTSECERFMWQLNGQTFASNMVITSLGGCDMVLGIQWLRTLGDTLWKFNDLKMSFIYKGNGLELRGTQQSGSTRRN
ncbi:uncharacterized protein [Rutidosis leptorrhynchoides]|uniref:uncharacterized protein n=1 Tax=Rutidosis leptorrhynchoides TaxID=125765 RepID=UPI003A99FBDD